jgi:hypothetical protein
MPRIELPPLPEGDRVPRLYASVVQAHQAEIDRLTALVKTDAVYLYLYEAAAPVHLSWVRVADGGEPLFLPSWALVEYDDGAVHLGDWLRRAYEAAELVVVWPDDTVTPAPQREPSAPYVDHGIGRDMWEAAGHAQRQKARS